MKGMKPSDIRARTDDELSEEVDTLSKEIFNLRFQRASGQLENTARVRQVRRDIARIKTILDERRRQPGQARAPARTPHRPPDRPVLPAGRGLAMVLFRRDVRLRRNVRLPQTDRLSRAAQELVDVANRDRPIPDRRRHPLNRAAAHVAGSEHAGQARLER